MPESRKWPDKPPQVRNVCAADDIDTVVTEIMKEETDMEREDQTGKKQKRTAIRKRFALRPIRLLLLAAVVAAAACFIRCSFFGGEEEQTTVLTSSQLAEVLKISELSVYKVTFNGVAAVNDEEGDLLYNVAYEAKVNVGFDTEELFVSVDETDAADKKIVVTLPDMEVMDAVVDPGSLDYIFAKKRTNTDDVSATAFPACKVDAEEECRANPLIFEQAMENAVHTIRGLTQPLLEQYEDYSLKIVDKGGVTYE